MLPIRSSCRRISAHCVSLALHELIERHLTFVFDMAMALLRRRADVRVLATPPLSWHSPTSPSTVCLRRMSTPVESVFPRTDSSSFGQQPPNTVLEAAVQARQARQDWTRDEIRAIYETRLMELVFQAVSPSEMASPGKGRHGD